MLQLRFAYDIARDVRNVWESFNGDYQSKVAYLLDDNAEMRLRDMPWPQVARATIEEHSRFRQNHGDFLRATIDSYRSYWIAERSQILALINTLFRKKFYASRVIAYLTLSSRCPYNAADDSFMVSVFADPIQALYTLAHELFHLQSHHTLFPSLTGWLQPQIEEFMEIITAVLDVEFAKLIPFFERDTINSSGLRKKALEIWIDTNDIYIVAREVGRAFTRNQGHVFET